MGDTFNHKIGRKKAMGFELWGMQGVVLVLFVIGVAFVLNWASKGKNYLKIIPFSQKGLGIVGILLIAVVGYSTAWWGYEGELGLPTVTEPEVTEGVTFEAEGSESVDNLIFDQNTRVFTCSFIENTATHVASVPASSQAATPTLVSANFTITVFRTDMATVTTENATSKIWATVPTFYGKNENASILYWPIDKDDTTLKYEIAFTPAGGSARDEYNYFTMGAGGSKAITVVADVYGTGLSQLDNMQSKDIIIHIYGLDETFTLRFLKIGESA